MHGGGRRFTPNATARIVRADYDAHPQFVAACLPGRRRAARGSCTGRKPSPRSIRRTGSIRFPGARRRRCKTRHGAGVPCPQQRDRVHDAADQQQFRSAGLASQHAHKEPDIVAHGRKPAIYACGFCHLPDGRGRPENATLAGLPADYIVRQMLDISHGTRRSASPKPSRPMELMKQMAESSTVSEMRQAASYFAKQKLRYSPRVIESAVVPKTHPSTGLYVKDPGVEFDSLGKRIIEFASDPRASRDPGCRYRVSRVCAAGQHRARARHRHEADEEQSQAVRELSWRNAAWREARAADRGPLTDVRHAPAARVQVRDAFIEEEGAPMREVVERS